MQANLSRPLSGARPCLARSRAGVTVRAAVALPDAFTKVQYCGDTG